jgi:predicted patatin/cPLA2 family phospholipase
MPRFVTLLLLAVVLAATACSYPDRLPSVPRTDTARAQPLGIPNARFFADDDLTPMIQEGMRSFDREIATLRAEGKNPTRANLPTAYYLAVSGGGDNGAFGAGLINGWSETGTRPEFRMVTGVSTGALIAPFAFLGPSYDAALREVYTTMTPDRVFRVRGLTAALFNDAMADTSPLAEVIAKYADEKMFAAIAREYNEGRLLLIGTTDLDAQRPVIWNIGALAASGKPGSLQLFHQILRASAAVPGLFQPVMIDVELDGKKYQEMHVDGGTIAQLFLYPPALEANRLLKRKRVAYIIRNARLDPDYAMAERRTVTVAGRAINTMLAASGHNDVLRTYFVSLRDGVDYNLSYIGSDFTLEKKGEFEQPYMQALYQYGYEQARSGREWHKVPPSFALQPVGTQSGSLSRTFAETAAAEGWRQR